MIISYISLSIIVDEDHVINLGLRTGSVSAQMANEANLCTEESWAVRTRNDGGSGWCGSAFLSFLHSSVATFLLASQTFTPCLTTSRHLSLSCTKYSRLLGWYQKISWRLSVCLWNTFFGLHGSTCPETVCHWAVSLGSGDLSCRQHVRPNKAVIASR